MVCIGTVQHTGTWFAISTIEHMLNQQMIQSDYIYSHPNRPREEQINFHSLREGLYHTHLPSGLVPYFMFDALANTHKTIITVRDPMLSLISRQNRYPEGSPHEDILDGFEYIASLDSKNIFWFPIDLYDTVKERKQLLLNLAEFLEVEPDEKYITSTAKKWDLVNTNHDISLLKAKYTSGDVKEVLNFFTKRGSRFLATQTGKKIKDFLIRVGYRDLPWFKFVKD